MAQAIWKDVYDQKKNEDAVMVVEKSLEPAAQPSAKEIAEELKPFITELITTQLARHKEELKETLIQLVALLPKPEIQIVEKEIIREVERPRKSLFNL